MPLSGEAKLAYQRDYMRKRRAGLVPVKPRSIACSFCGEVASSERPLVAGDRVRICGTMHHRCRGDDCQRVVRSACFESIVRSRKKAPHVGKCEAFRFIDQLHRTGFQPLRAFRACASSWEPPWILSLLISTTSGILLAHSRPTVATSSARPSRTH